MLKAMHIFKRNNLSNSPLRSSRRHSAVAVVGRVFKRGKKSEIGASDAKKRVVYFLEVSLLYVFSQAIDDTDWKCD